MSADRLAWIIRAAMVATSAVVTYLLVQTELDLWPIVTVALGAINVALAALSPAGLASRVNGNGAPKDG